MEWTDELIARLKELWEQGLSTAEIGRQLSITKNAVVGKAHRLGLPPRPSPIRNKAAAEGTRKQPRVDRSDKLLVMVRESVETEENAEVGWRAVSQVTEEKIASSITTFGEEKKAVRVKGVKETKKVKVEAPLKGTKDRKNTGRVEGSEADKASIRPGEQVSRRKRASLHCVSDVMDRSSRQGPVCQWPIGDPSAPDFHFCGVTPLPGKPYCAEHAAIAYVKVRDRRH
ncbi:GcrA family cell cycle regulator [Bombella sp. TMW 2.2559]|uniref:GcrA family cell cycle regulator n=1 Tax=Bombella dulcis TaxID=2967339 RepID=A0ABT3WEW1_9PROT|nr:GcrA family cell cycle regulator [Bombella dulcis]MCX5616879.1 GcrA family cell cycle regulator [Bombella dulcis]